MPVKKKTVTSSKRLNLLLETMERLHHIKDLQTLLDTLLSESRKFTGSDAGSIYLVENGKLKFSYVQNETIFKTDLLCNKYIYSNQELEISKKSVAGYVAQTGRALMIKDAYNLEARAPYTFNRYFDEISAYRTRSMLIVPLKTSRGDVIGVIQLINATTKSGKVVAYSDEDKLFVTQFAFQAAVAIERALTLRELVLRMVRVAELRDPEETQLHLYRVSSYAAELYRSWADNHGVPRSEVTNYRDIFSVAAMLHDIGKVGIPDHILRKRGKLTPEEYGTIQLHTVYGERLFQSAHSELDRMAHELILNHHEKWDGTGYPGAFKRDGDRVVLGPGKRGSEIPLSARIIALADVYDALINKRIYKDAWEEDAVLYYIKQQSGKHFDPEIVKIFFGIYDVIKAIRAKWS